MLVDDGRQEPQRALRFSRLLGAIQANTADELGPALRAINIAIATGKYAAGYISYEAGYLLERRLESLLPASRVVPLLWFGIFAPPQALTGAQLDRFFSKRGTARAYTGPLRHEWKSSKHYQAFRRARALIHAGDVYQVNLSFRSHFNFVGAPLSLYAGLRGHAAAAHSAYVDDGQRQILSLSPELFFSISRDGHIVTKPMKGTAPREENPIADAAARARLYSSEKERAENLMIVDLLRNDLGRIALPASVSVEKLFEVETYPTVHQMVSTVTARLQPGLQATQILHALFPCGSVTGAPKIRAMEIIRELESSPRGVYCGGIGYFGPDGSASFNVGIRTLTICGDGGELGIGGAIVSDSSAAAEYEECLLKARYFEAARKPIALIETLRWSPAEGFVRLSRHLARIEASAKSFGLLFDRAAVLSSLEKAVQDGSLSQRVRLTLSENGQPNCTARPLPRTPARWRYIISRERVLESDELLRHKTSWRELFDREAARAATLGCDEVIFLNRRGEVTEGARANIFIRVGKRLITPALACGLLNGCLRQELIENGQCSEAILYPQNLCGADKVYFGNSLRGLIPATLASAP